MNLRCKKPRPLTRAEKLDDSPGDRWPQKTGTRVYRVVKEMLPG